MNVSSFLGILESKIPFLDITIGSILIAVITIIIGYIVAVIVSKYLARVMSKADMSGILVGFTTKVFKILIIIFSIAAAIGFLGVDVGAAIISISVVSGFVIGFAFQETLGNLAAGFMIAVVKPFKKDDFVQVSDILGRVESVGASVTTLVTYDNKKVVVPNSNIWGNPVTNYTAFDKRMIDMTIGIGYGDDMNKAIKIVMKLLKGHPNVLENPSPMVAVNELGDSSVNLIVRPWTKTGDYWSTKRELTQQIKEAFDEEGISIPFPQRDIHMIKE
ncbi:MAG: mechanosensitive ion channel family protein [Candidatus Thermoplasmatota archaeon]